MKNQTIHKTVISLNIPIALLDKVDELCHKRRIGSRSQVIKQLLECGLYVENKIGTVETWSSEDMEEIRKQFESGTMVDWLKELDFKTFSTFMHVFDDEKKSRGMKK